MTKRERFDYIGFIIFYAASAAVAVTGMACGARAALITGGVMVTLAAAACTAALLKPALKAGRCYRSLLPRKMYMDISSREGYTLLGDMNPALIEAARCAEDSRFFIHRGINWNSVIHAFINNVIERKKRVGGSTITQQLIKNVYLSHDAGMDRKLTELLMVSRLERDLSKNEIMELYLNVIYYGNDIYGITDAARYYYDKTPAELDFDQCVSLICLLPCPDKYNIKAGTELFSLARQHVYSALASRSDMKFGELAEIYTHSKEPR